MLLVIETLFAACPGGPAMHVVKKKNTKSSWEIIMNAYAGITIAALDAHEPKKCRAPCVKTTSACVSKMIIVVQQAQIDKKMPSRFSWQSKQLKLRKLR